MNLTDQIVGGGTHPVILFAIAFVLGALHGLEPGHSKTMIAAYIVAVRGTVFQAVLLGVSAAVSHSIIVWVLAGIALTAGNELIAEVAEPYFMVVSGMIVLVIGAWMAGRLAGERAARPAFAGAFGGVPATHSQSRSARHEPTRFLYGGESPAQRDEHDHAHAHDHDHGDRAASQRHGADMARGDAHARVHAAEIQRRLGSGRTSAWQTMLFGLTGGLIPCPAAITVLLICLHLDNIGLGIGLVTGFSIGLGVTLVTVGVVAAWGTGLVARRTGGLIDRWTNRLPYLSSGLIGLVGIAMVAAGMSHLAAS